MAFSMTGGYSSDGYSSDSSEGSITSDDFETESYAEESLPVELWEIVFEMLLARYPETHPNRLNQLRQVCKVFNGILAGRTAYFKHYFDPYLHISPEYTYHSMRSLFNCHLDSRHPLALTLDQAGMDFFINNVYPLLRRAVRDNYMRTANSQPLAFEASSAEEDIPISLRYATRNKILTLEELQNIIGDTQRVVTIDVLLAVIRYAFYRSMNLTQPAFNQQTFAMLLEVVRTPTTAGLSPEELMQRGAEHRQRIVVGRYRYRLRYVNFGVLISSILLFTMSMYFINLITQTERGIEAGCQAKLGVDAALCHYNNHLPYPNPFPPNVHFSQLLRQVGLGVEFRNSMLYVDCRTTGALGSVGADFWQSIGPEATKLLQTIQGDCRRQAEYALQHPSYLPSFYFSANIFCILLALYFIYISALRPML